MDIKIIPTHELDKKFTETYISLMVKSEKEIGEGNLDIEITKRGIRELGFKFLSSQAIKKHNTYTYIVFYNDKLVGKYAIKLELLEGKVISLLDYIYIKKKYRGRGISSHIIEKITIEHNFFGIQNPLRESLNFWNKIINRMFDNGVSSSAYIIIPFSDKTNGYLCVGGDSIIITDLGVYPAIILKHKFSLDELNKVSNQNIMPIPEQIKNTFRKNFLQKQ